MAGCADSFKARFGSSLLQFQYLLLCHHHHQLQLRDRGQGQLKLLLLQIFLGQFWEATTITAKGKGAGAAGDGYSTGATGDRYSTGAAGDGYNTGATRCYNTGATGGNGSTGAMAGWLAMATLVQWLVMATLVQLLVMARVVQLLVMATGATAGYTAPIGGDGQANTGATGLAWCNSSCLQGSLVVWQRWHNQGIATNTGASMAKEEAEPGDSPSTTCSCDYSWANHSHTEQACRGCWLVMEILFWQARCIALSGAWQMADWGRVEYLLQRFFGRSEF